MTDSDQVEDNQWQYKHAVVKTAADFALVVGNLVVVAVRTDQIVEAVGMAAD